MKQLLRIGLLSCSLVGHSQAADYLIDTKDKHASITFRIQHLGFSWLYGRFNDFSGSFSFDEKKPEEANVEVIIKTASVDTNHAERDKHLRSPDILNTDKFPDAKFVSTSYESNGDGTGVLEGNLTLNGITKLLQIDVEEMGAGKDPWGGERRGFEGSTEFALADYGINYDFGPATKTVELMLSIEGIKQ